MINITDSEKLPKNDKNIMVEDNVWIGANATILNGTAIHSGAIISAGSVVTKDVAKNTIVGEVPAKLIRKR